MNRYSFPCYVRSPQRARMNKKTEFLALNVVVSAWCPPKTMQYSELCAAPSIAWRSASFGPLVSPCSEHRLTYNTMTYPDPSCRHGRCVVRLKPSKNRPPHVPSHVEFQCLRVTRESKTQRSASSDFKCTVRRMGNISGAVYQGRS